MKELWQYSGEPTTEEIIQRSDFWSGWDIQGVKGNHLRIWKPCINCGGDNTEHIRNQWYACYDCMIAWDPFEQCYGVQAYDSDPRIEQELLEEIGYE